MIKALLWIPINAPAKPDWTDSPSAGISSGRLFHSNTSLGKISPDKTIIRQIKNDKFLIIDHTLLKYFNTPLESKKKFSLLTSASEILVSGSLTLPRSKPRILSTDFKPDLKQPVS